MKRNASSFFKITFCLLSVFAAGSFLYKSSELPAKSVAVISQVGSSGAEVTAIQETLKDYGLFEGEVTGYYGEQTKKAVLRFQKARGISQTGIAGEQTLAALGITVGQIPAATEANINLLARIISAEGRGEVYSGQVAIGACVLNRIEHPSFPDTLAGVIYQNGAFTAITDGQFNEPVADSAYRAARDALNGVDPTGGAIYYYNPDKTDDTWIRQKEVICRIGNHLFAI